MPATIEELQFVEVTHDVVDMSNNRLALYVPLPRVLHDKTPWYTLFKGILLETHDADVLLLGMKRALGHHSTFLL